MKQFLHIRFPDEKEENYDALQTVENVKHMQDKRVLEPPRNDFNCPSYAHDNEESKIKEKSVKYFVGHFVES